MHRTPLTKLRISFLGLGATLFVALAWLVHSINVRVEAHRRLRHQVVAERIFDELERELTRVLSEEAARPSQAFDGEGPAARSPYVIGYFRTEADAPVFLRAANPDAAERMTRALASARLVAKNQAPIETDEYAKPVKQSPPGSLGPAEILRKLNRAREDRQDFGAR